MGFPRKSSRKASLSKLFCKAQMTSTLVLSNEKYIILLFSIFHYSQARRSGVRIPVWTKIFSVSKGPDRVCDAPSSLLLSGYRCTSSGVRRPEREVYRSPPSSAEVTNEWSYTSTPPICVNVFDRDSFTYYSFAKLKLWTAIAQSV